MPIEVRLRQHEGMSRKKRCVALTASGTIGQATFRDAVEAPAMRADDLNVLTHT